MFGYSSVQQANRALITTSEEIAGFHQLVEDGDLESLCTALRNGANVNAPGRLGRTALMVAIDAKNVEKAKLLIGSGADAEQTDDFNNTALRHAVDADFEEGVRYLIRLGVDRGQNPKYPLKKINYDVALGTGKMPEQLKEVMSEAEWKESIEKSREILRDIQPTVEPAISAVQSVTVLKLFLRAGDDLGLASTEMKRACMGLETSRAFRATRADYEIQKAPRYGIRNPEPMDILFWRDMIRTGGNAYSARTHFKDEDPFRVARTDCGHALSVASPRPRRPRWPDRLRSGCGHPGRLPTWTGCTRTHRPMRLGRLELSRCRHSSMDRELERSSQLFSLLPIHQRLRSCVKDCSSDSRSNAPSLE